MGQVPAKAFPTPASFGQSGTNALTQAKMTPQAPGQSFTSLNYQNPTSAPTAGQTLPTLQNPFKPRPTGLLSGLG